jgi:3D (Asp-Asp-Asp) domain-containing protein
MIRVYSRCIIPQIIPALCLTAIIQFVALAQAATENNALQAGRLQMAQVSEKAEPKLLESYHVDFSALSTSLCSPKAFLNAFAGPALASAQSPIRVKPVEPKIQLPHPPVDVAVRPPEQKLNKISFAEPDEHSKHAPKTFHASAYAIQGRTRTGVKTSAGVIAADPRVLPLGTVVQVNAGKYSGVYTVHDTGGAIKGNRVDVWMPTTKEARRFGRRNVKLVVLRYPGQNQAPVEAAVKPAAKK